ncbi:hypothetical protein ACFL0H_09945, partial [Thermodesulfobacteriota bacterium]
DSLHPGAILPSNMNHKTAKGAEKMKTKKKYFIIGGVIIFIIFLTGFGLVAAWGPGKCFDRGFHPAFHGRGFHPGFHGRDFSEFILWRMDKRVKELDLSEEQNEKYNLMRSNLETHFSRGMQERQRLRETFRSEIGREDPDVRLLAESLKEKISEISGFIDENLDLVMDFYESLNRDQKEMILDAVRTRMERAERT